MTVRTALILRLLGPLIEIVCVMVLLKVRDQERRVLGIPVEYPLYAGLALGLSLVVVGLIFSRPAKRRPFDPDH
jgi:cation transporter-like permease